MKVMRSKNFGKGFPIKKKKNKIEKYSMKNFSILKLKRKNIFNSFFNIYFFTLTNSPDLLSKTNLTIKVWISEIKPVY